MEKMRLCGPGWGWNVVILTCLCVEAARCELVMRSLVTFIGFRVNVTIQFWVWVCGCFWKV